jgi:hypothetical protein
MSEKNPRKQPTEPTAIQPVRKPKVFAGTCPKNPAHQNTQVYSTKGKTRHCKCNDCGETWKQSGDFASPLLDYCETLAASLDAAPRSDAPGGGLVVVLTDKDAREIARTLRELVKQ